MKARRPVREDYCSYPRGRAMVLRQGHKVPAVRDSGILDELENNWI